MVTVQLLKRKDASSVVVAVVLALILSQMITTVTSELSYKLVGMGNFGPYSGGPGWKATYLQPVIWVILQLLLLEVLVKLYVLVNATAKKK